MISYTVCDKWEPRITYLPRLILKLPKNTISNQYPRVRRVCTHLEEEIFCDIPVCFTNKSVEEYLRSEKVKKLHLVSLVDTRLA
jgi:hypothetical protein